MSAKNDLQQALETGSYVRLNLEDGGHEGFVIGLSNSFVMLQAIYEWQDYGAMVIRLDAVESCDVSEYQQDQLKIIEFNSVKRTKRYGWVNLTGFEALFKSLAPKNKFVVLSIDDEAEVGLISEITNDAVTLKAVDPGGNWIDEAEECPYDDIVSVQFDDNYSRVLQRYVERSPSLN